MVQPTEDPGVLLARRLRALRKQHWPGHALTQTQLTKVLGVSGGLISAWEKENPPTQPPTRHLETYARFFATERSVERTPFRLLKITELTPAERSDHDRLLAELTALRDAARSAHRAPETTGPATFWHFPYDQDVTIVCGHLPPDRIGVGPHVDPNSPDYDRLSHFADRDTLIELYGHLRATNPHNTIKYLTSDELMPTDYTAHLVLIGGVDRNLAVRNVLLRTSIPVTQEERPEDADYGGFVVREDGPERIFEPLIATEGHRRILTEDIAHFYRGPNPYNVDRTVTLLNGMFSRGTLGLAMALIDGRLGPGNEAYLHERFADADTFSVLTRVPVVGGLGMAPNWTVPTNLLHEWSTNSGADYGTQP